MTPARLPRLVVAATHSGAGKTTVATGLMAALTAAGHAVAPGKVGPDFIDPGYHALATGRPGRNLDAFLSGADLLAPLLLAGAAGADLAVVEGVMGLFDGRTGTGGEASTAHVARLLDAPVLLVVDARGMGDSVVPLVAGFRTHDPRVRLAGLVLNRVGSSRHAAVLRAALAAADATRDLPVVGVLRRDPALASPSRHLGLVPAAERPEEARRTVAALGARVTAAFDLPAVLRLAATAPPLRVPPWSPPQAPAAGVRIAVAGGPAFSFAYTEHRELLAAAGAEVVDLDPLRDEALPPGTDALYLGGGFPEAHAGTLSANVRLRRTVAALAAGGSPVLAECGGLLYLCQSLDGHPMAGVLPATATVGPRLVLGYREAVAARAAGGWRAGDRVRGHEFHHGVVEPAAGGPGAVGGAPAWRWRDAAGGTREDGFVHRGAHASFLHLHWTSSPDVATRFVARARAAARTAGAAGAAGRPGRSPQEVPA